MRPDDSLEKFVRKNRQAFDDQSPPADIWGRIEATLGGSPRRSFSWMWKAAAVLFFVSTAILLTQEYWFGPPQRENVIAAELKDAEQYYNSLIQVKREELGQFDLDKGLIMDFEQDIAELDSMYIVLKDEYTCNNDELVMDAMIRNLQIRLEVMDRQLRIIQNIKNNKNENETVSI